MIDKPLISIIIPCYNDAKYIEQSVNSALNQTYKNIEVIVIDDGSNAETKSILKSIESKLTKLITQENKGQSTARNVGINLAQGDFILVLDSDDFFEPTFCEKALLIFKGNTNVEIVTCNANLLFEYKRNDIYCPIGGDLNNFLIRNCALGTSMFKRDSWEKVKGYDESMRKGFEDWEFFIRILIEGGTCQVIPEALYNYRKKIISTTSKANKNKYKLLNYIYTKHKDLYIENYKPFVSHLLKIAEREENEKLKNTQRVEFKIGKALLKPLRFIKALIK
jgi:glycosyltransferase involved in cell wall biosynthesis